jgi:hypothetical protein
MASATPPLLIEEEKRRLAENAPEKVPIEMK